MVMALIISKLILLTSPLWVAHPSCTLASLVVMSVWLVSTTSLRTKSPPKASCNTINTSLLIFLADMQVNLCLSRIYTTSITNHTRFVARTIFPFILSLASFPSTFACPNSCFTLRHCYCANLFS